MANVLEKIVADKREEVAARKDALLLLALPTLQ